MENEPKCPHCGTECLECDISLTEWKCGSHSRNHQSEECKDRELATLRNHNRDLQQAYDHVLKCEQNRCREVVELQDKLAEMTVDRDALSRRNRPVPNMKRQSTPTNCFRTCVAQLLGLGIDAVPLGCDGASWDWNQFQNWLAERGLQAVEIGFANGGTLYNVQNPVPCIITGKSPRECKTGMHAVVGLFTGLDGFEINGDPHPSEMWIDGDPTHAVFFVPINPRCADELAELQRRIDEAPVICSEGMTENDAYEVVEREWSEHPESTFRLVRDDQPGETNA